MLWRMNAFGCHGESGCRFVERILTVVPTLRLQKRSVLNFLEESVICSSPGRAGTCITHANVGLNGYKINWEIIDEEEK